MSQSHPREYESEIQLSKGERPAAFAAWPMRSKRLQKSDMQKLSAQDSDDK
ncbi:hypothetical protein PLUTE_a3735 [Pseudoalteromonas luteoviolacea DSM 6061]|nr:hypothetical protein [Pseudoalteromonas luteoviolacea DSM 6061]